MARKSREFCYEQLSKKVFNIMARKFYKLTGRGDKKYRLCRRYIGGNIVMPVEYKGL